MDVIAALEAIMHQNTAYYQSDFAYDIKMLREAARSDQPEDKLLLWLSRPSGTFCFRERDVLLKNTQAYNTWKFCGEQTHDRILAYAVELTGAANGTVQGNLYELDYQQHFQHIREAADILRRLHRSGEDTGIPFEVFSMAASYEKIIADKQVPMFSDYAEVKAEVMAAKRQIDAACDIAPVPCHNDVLCENWVVSDAGKMYLIDWEYAGMNDGIWDVADLSIEAVYDHALDEVLLRAYLGREPETMDWKHFLANKLYVDYLWTLWAKARVPYDGQPMEDWAAERYARLKKNLLEFQKV